MVKVRVIVPIFNDLKEGKQRKMGEVYETTEKRAKELVNFSYNGNLIKIVEIVEVVPEKQEELKKENTKIKKENVTKKTRKKIDKKAK